MNPNAQTLDPKLKEAYDRVMGAQFAPQPPTSNATLSPSPSPSITSSESSDSGPTVSPSATPSSVAQTAIAPAESQVFVASPVTPNNNAAVVKNPGKKMSPVIMIVLGFVFLVVYTVVWLKVFAIF